MIKDRGALTTFSLTLIFFIEWNLCESHTLEIVLYKVVGSTFIYFIQ